MDAFVTFRNVYGEGGDSPDLARTNLRVRKGNNGIFGISHYGPLWQSSASNYPIGTVRVPPENSEVREGAI